MARNVRRADMKKGRVAGIQQAFKSRKSTWADPQNDNLWFCLLVCSFQMYMKVEKYEAVIKQLFISNFSQNDTWDQPKWAEM